MSREAMVATLLFPAAAGIAWLAPAWAWVAALLALAFVYCQARMLRAARAIPAWREPLSTPMLVLTGLTEGAGLGLVASALMRTTSDLGVTTFGLLVIARAIAWFAYRRRVAAPARALAALDQAGGVMAWAGTALPLVLLALAQVAWADLAALAGVAAALAGAYFKLVLVTRAGFNQGFALARMPVRGERRGEA
jgi:phenylacetyl-CoA:acceptor oxidoreductase subunit 2